MCYLADVHESHDASFVRRRSIAVQIEKDAVQ
jgi:hypothetical protein